MSGYMDYMLLLRPDEEICREIKGYKNFASELVGDYPSMHSTPHISVMKYTRRKPYIMRQAIDGLNISLKAMPAVQLKINGFKFFIHKNDTYTIYAAIEPTFQSDRWFALLSKHLRLPKGSFIPHITIARTINENAFFKLWPNFKYINFQRRFLVNCLTVLERETLNSRAKWAIYQEMLFKVINEDQPA